MALDAPSQAPKIKDQSRYACKDFWNERFISVGTRCMEWYASYFELYEIMQYVIENHPLSSTLVIGCGNSDLSYHLSSSHYFGKVLSIDISPAVIECMKSRHPDLEYRVVDCTSMAGSFAADTSFDVLIDKGTFDALICDVTNVKAKSMLSNVSALLHTSSIFVLVSNRPDRKGFVEHDQELYVCQIWRCDLCDEALLANIAYSSRRKPDDQSLARESLDDHEDNIGSMFSEFDEAASRKRSARVLREFMRRTGNVEGAQRSILLYDKRGLNQSKDGSSLPSVSRRSNYCYVYIIRKICC